MALQLPVYPPFDIHQDKPPGPRWKKWKKRLANLFGAMKITDADQQKAMMLHYGGEPFNDLVDTLTIPASTNALTDYDQLVATLDGYFEPKKNLEYEIYIFREATQKPEETIDQFHVRLRHLSGSCEFTNVDREIQSQIVLKCRSAKLRRQALRETMTLKRLLDTARTLELSESRAKDIEKLTAPDKPDVVNRVDTNKHSNQSQKPNQKQNHGKRYHRGPWKPNPQKPNTETSKSTSTCGLCGGTYPHPNGREGCPANRKTCSACKRTGHFAKVCRATQYKVNQVTSRDSSDEEFAFGVNLIGAIQNHPNLPNTNVKINGQTETFIIDSGATVNVMDKDMYGRLGQPKLKKTSVVLSSYGSEGDKIPILGTLTTTIESKKAITVSEIHVVNRQNCGSLLSYRTASELGLIHVANQITSPDMEQTVTKPILGKLRDYQQTISIDPNVKPVAQPPRRVPFNLRDAVENQIKHLLDLDVIEETSGPTPWVSPLVVVPKKNGDIRICVDMRQANRAVTRERYPMPTFDEILHDMHGSSWFTKLDLNMGFHQIELAEESRGITTFACHMGLYRYKRLMFGISCAPEIYQHIIRMTLQGCPGVQNVSDDIIVYGSTMQEHDQRLKKVLERLKDRGLTLNESKCQYHMREISFLGHNLSEKGISADKSKIEAINQATQPQDAQHVRSFLGLANYCARFIPNFASIAEPLRRLTRSNQPFTWDKDQQTAFSNLKDALVSNRVMAYYDKDAETQVIVDASPVGLGGVLVQKQKDGSYRPISYASKALSPVEQKYSQTEREALAIVWGCEKFSLYLLGKLFTLVTDHRALEFMYSPKTTSSARVERWALRLQPYTYKVVYKPGPTNIADSLSRLIKPGSYPSSLYQRMAEEYVCFIARSAKPRAMTLPEIEQESASDTVLSSVRTALKSGNWDNIPKDYLNVKDELTKKGKLVLRHNRIVVPSALTRHTLELAHEGHQGIIKTKQRLRTKVWWPHMERDSEDFVKSCVPCQANGTGFRPEEIQPTPIPDGPWKELAIDIAGDFPTGEYIVVLIDYYSRWPEILITKSITSSTIITWLKKVFACHGLPEKLTSDNGPQFSSAEFAQYLSSNSVHHHKVTPYWPQANGLVERMNRNLLKAIRCASLEGKDWRESLLDFVVAYRSTQQCTTGISPSYALFGREIRTKLPQIDLNHKSQNMAEKDAQSKLKTKLYADANRHTKPADLHPGDQVLLRQRRNNKLTSRFS